MRLPRGPGWFIRRLMTPADLGTRSVPLLATLLILCGARLPDWHNTSTGCGFILWTAVLVGQGSVSLLRDSLLICNLLPDPESARVDRRFEKRAAIALLVSVTLLLFPLPAYAGFALSRHAFDRAAEQLLARPFTEEPVGGRWIGVYYIDQINRCPHGLEFFSETYDAASGDRLRVGMFIYKNVPGECEKHHPLGPHLGGDWYLAASK